VNNVYGHVVALLSRCGIAFERGAVHLDVGCGFGAIAGPLSSATGLHYVGIDPDGSGKLSSSGFEFWQLRLGNKEQTLSDLRGVIGSRKLASISCIDFLEHVDDPGSTLRAFRAIAGEEVIPLVTSVPNVTHADVAIKQLFGRFEATDAGILDRTHLQYFTNDSLIALLRECGWEPSDAFDVEYRASDQHFPKDHIGLVHGSLLARHLFQIKREADLFYITNQLVRLSYPSGGQVAIPHASPREKVFLSVLIPTSASEADLLSKTLSSLLRQDNLNFEVLVLGLSLKPQESESIRQRLDLFSRQSGVRSRLVSCEKLARPAAINEAMAEMNSDYTIAVDAGAQPRENWVSVFAELAAKQPGAFLRAGFATKSQEADAPFPEVSQMGKRAWKIGFDEAFEYFDIFMDDTTPSCAFAWPVSLARDLNRRYDETLAHYFAWDFFVRGIAVCGVAASETITSFTSPKAETGDRKEWKRVRAGFDTLTILFPPGILSRVLWRLREGGRGTG
jgi:2-polyprenyl-3-methyl-5-hydroxy-6-metoxy-1,4-benzoquinol methylase